VTVPAALRRAWKAWKRLGRRLGHAQAVALLTVFYFTVLAPFALLVRVATDPLTLRRRTPRGWREPRTPAADALDDARRQA
jgi:hypothetical protein